MGILWLDDLGTRPCSSADRFYLAMPPYPLEFGLPCPCCEPSHRTIGDVRTARWTTKAVILRPNSLTFQYNDTIFKVFTPKPGNWVTKDKKKKKTHLILKPYDFVLSGRYRAVLSHIQPASLENGERVQEAGTATWAIPPDRWLHVEAGLSRTPWPKHTHSLHDAHTFAGI